MAAYEEPNYDDAPKEPAPYVPPKSKVPPTREEVWHLIQHGIHNVGLEAYLGEIQQALLERRQYLRSKGRPVDGDPYVEEFSSFVERHTQKLPPDGKPRAKGKK